MAVGPEQLNEPQEGYQQHPKNDQAAAPAKRRVTRAHSDRKQPEHCNECRQRIEREEIRPETWHLGNVNERSPHKDQRHDDESRENRYLLELARHDPDDETEHTEY